MSLIKETDLYLPVKQFLESQGYQIRGEVNGCDLVACREEELLIVELKRSFNLSLVLQGMERLKLTDRVYLAAPSPRTARSGPRLAQMRDLCQRLGLGLLLVRLSRRPVVEVACEPESYLPRHSPKGRSILLKEFNNRSGDHNVGGSTGRPIVTAYREEALRVALFLREHGPSKVQAIRAGTASARVATILQSDYYGWFQRVARGVYRLTAVGEAGLNQYDGVVGINRRA